MILEQVIASISPASQAHAAAARANVRGAGAAMLERLAERLGGAQHTPRPRAARRTIVVVCGDHGVGDPGIAMKADHPTVVAASAIANGSAALCQVARASQAPIVIVDAGVREPAHMPAQAIRLGTGPSRTTEPTLTTDEVTAGLEAGLALAMSIGEADLLVVGALGLGAEVASAALLGAASGTPPGGLADPLAEAAGARGVTAADPLASFGGPDTCVLAGLMLGAASIDVPVILDSYATGAAALAAARLCPHVTGYLVAAHRGSFTQPAILAQLGLTPIFEVGLGHGEGTGAAMVLPLADQVAALAARS